MKMPSRDEILFQQEQHDGDLVLALTSQWEDGHEDNAGYNAHYLEFYDEAHGYEMIERVGILELRRWHRLIGERIEAIEEEARENGIELPQGETTDAP